VINTGSPLAVLMASLVVCASGDVVANERHHSAKATYISTKVRSSDKQAWISAIINDDTTKLSRLLDLGNSTSLIQITASNGKSALMVATKTGDLVLAERLVVAGASVNELTETQGTPFMFAILGGHRDVAQWLLDQGADINTVGSNGWSALTISAAKGQVPLLQWLISEGAYAQLRDVYRFTPLLRAVENGHIEAAAVLLSLVDTDVNARDESENTALHHAVASRNTALVNLLLEHSANPQLLNRKGKSPMDMARALASDSETLLHAMESNLAPDNP